METGFKIKRQFKKTSRFLKNKFRSFTPLFELIDIVHTKQEKKQRKQIAKNTLFGAVSWQNENLSELKVALSLGADINTRDSRGRTALMIAVQIGHVKSTKLLIKRGADIDLQDKWGLTALMFASINNRTVIVKHLIKECANPLLKNNDGKTAYLFAKDPEIKNMLLEYELKWRFDKIKTSVYKEIYAGIQDCSPDKIYLAYQTL